MTMIELHYASNGNVIWVNVDSIIAIESLPVDKDNKSHGCEVDCLDDACYCVKESPYEIQNMLNATILRFRIKDNHNYQVKKHSVKTPRTVNNRIKKQLPPVKFETK